MRACVRACGRVGGGVRFSDASCAARTRLCAWEKHVLYVITCVVAHVRRSLCACVRTLRHVEYIRSLKGYEKLYEPSPPYFSQKIKDLAFATDITKKMEDCFVHFENLPAHILRPQ